MELRVNISELISLVQKTPVLWDYSSENYKNRHSTASAWKDVCRQLHEDFDSLDEKDQFSFTQSVSRKWKNLRDTWQRTKRKAQLNPSLMKGYQDRLDFLYKNKPCFSQPESTTIGDTAEEVHSIPIATIQESAIREKVLANEPFQIKVRRVSEIPKRSDDSKINLRGRLEPPTDNQDRHALFFRSILPTLNRLNEEQILEFQLRVLRMLQEIRKPKKVSILSMSRANPRTPVQLSKDSFTNGQQMVQTSDHSYISAVDENGVGSSTSNTSNAPTGTYTISLMSKPVKVEPSTNDSP